MPRKCSICGSPEISLFWSPKCGKAYGSFHCSTIGGAGQMLFLGIILFIATIIAVVIFSLGAGDPFKAMFSVIGFGSLAILSGLASAIGYYMKRKI